jgi:hypothetical protein
MDEKKPIWKSKTFWTAIGVVVLSIVEGPIKDMIKTQPPIAGSILGIVIIVLRFITTEGVKLK